MTRVDVRASIGPLRLQLASLHLGPALDSKTTLPAAAVPPKEQASRPTGLLPKR